MIVRELTGGVYFGEPRGIENLPDGGKRAVDTQVYTTPEIERVARVGFELAASARDRVTSVEKANVMHTGVLWRADGAGAARARLSPTSRSSTSMPTTAPCSSSPAQAVRRDRHRQPVRRHAVRLSRPCSRARSACCPRPRSAHPTPTAGARRSTSRSTARPPTSPARGSPTRSPASMSFAMLLRYSFDMGAEADRSSVRSPPCSKGLPHRRHHAAGMTPVSTSGMGDAVLEELDRCSP